MSANPKNPNAGLNVAEAPKALDEKIKAHGSVLGGKEALQALLAFSALHEQIRQKRNPENHNAAPDGADTWKLEQFVLDEVLHLVAERAQAITGADGVAIALADRDAIVCRASVGMIVPDPGVRLDTNSGFSGTCFRSAEVVRCDDSESDLRVDVQNCRRLGARSMVAVPLLAKSNVVGLLEAFSTEAYAFNDGDVRGLKLLAELILAAMKPEEEDRLAEISRNVVAESSSAEKKSKNEPSEPEVSGAAFSEPTVSEPGEDQKSFPATAVSEIPLRSGLPEGFCTPDSSLSEQTSISARKTETTPADDDAELALLRSYVSAENAGTSNSKPGLMLVLLLVVVAIGIGGYVWWGVQRRAHVSITTESNARSANSATNSMPEQAPSIADTGKDSNSATSTPIQAGAKHEGMPAVTGVRHWSSPDSSTVVVDLQDQVQYEAHRLTNPNRIYFDLHDTVLPSALAGEAIKIGDAFLQRVRIAQPVKGITRVVLETTAATSSFSVSMEESPYRLVVEVGKGNTKLQPGAPADSPGAGVLTPAIAPAISQSQLKPGVATKLRIVVDPGHGGWDLGTVGRSGLLEKDLVLDIADRLGSMLQKELNAEVVFTRTDNTYISLERRAEIANLSKADLFVSIHANYSSSASARGVETYYTNTYSSIHARTETGDTQAGTPPNWTAIDIRGKVQGSERLAASVQRTLYGMLAANNPGLENRGTKEASYVVLTGTTMPAILAEVSFVSSPTDETKLMQEAYREKIAHALYEGISRYVAESRKVKVAAIPKSSIAQ